MKRPNPGEFQITLIDNASLAERLARELRFFGHQLKQAWPSFKRDPVGFGRNAFTEAGLRLRRALAAPNSLAAITTALLIVIVAATILLLTDKISKEKDPRQDDNELAQIGMLTFPEATTTPDGQGVGANSNGRVGIAGGKGEGSGPKPKKSTGGGSGGDHDPLPAQVGKVPPPSEIPAPIPQFPPAQKQALPAAGVDIDPALWKNLPMAVYGDPRSTSSTPSNGPGADGGMGTANGTGIGEGRGPGFGPGQDGNIGDGTKGIGCCGPGGSNGNNSEGPDRVFSAALVTERARVIAKPEPQYTEEARRNQVSGSVVLRVVFSRTGEVTNIRAISPLPFGLTERAIAAARLIRFRPATKDGQPVNVYVQLEYNFNLY